MITSTELKLNCIQSSRKKPVLKSDDQKLLAAVCGRTMLTSRLLTVQRISGVYGGEVGDVVIGRVVALGNSKWILDINARLFAQLPLSAVTLPGAELVTFVS